MKTPFLLFASCCKTHPETAPSTVPQISAALTGLIHFITKCKENVWLAMGSGPDSRFWQKWVKESRYMDKKSKDCLWLGTAQWMADLEGRVLAKDVTHPQKCEQPGRTKLNVVTTPTWIHNVPASGWNPITICMGKPKGCSKPHLKFLLQLPHSRLSLTPGGCCLSKSAWKLRNSETAVRFLYFP